MTNPQVPVPKNRRGFVLIVVLWAVAIVTIIALGFGQRAVLDTTAATYSVDYAQAMMEARGAAERGMVELLNKPIVAQLKGAQGVYTYLGESWAQPGDLYKDNVYFDKKNHGKNDTATFTIIDADRYINVNNSSGENEEVLKNAKVKPSILRKIHHRLREIDPKEGQPTAFAELEELRYLEGVEDDDWFGTDRHPGLKDLLTVAGSGKINVNTAPLEVLRAIPGLKGKAKQIVSYRNGEDGIPGTPDDRAFVHEDDIAAKLNIEVSGAELLKYCSFDSTCFIITGTATRQGGKVRASCTATVNVASGVISSVSWKEDPAGA